MTDPRSNTPYPLFAVPQDGSCRPTFRNFVTRLEYPVSTDFNTEQVEYIIYCSFQLLSGEQNFSRLYPGPSKYQVDQFTRHENYRFSRYMPPHHSIHINSIIGFLDPRLRSLSLFITYMREVYSSDSIVRHVNCLHALIYLLTVIVKHPMFSITEDDFNYVFEFYTLYSRICTILDEVEDICEFQFVSGNELYNTIQVTWDLFRDIIGRISTNYDCIDYLSPKSSI
jgi:hypothetical protein